MTDYVLVHGAWCGSWAYDRLAADLETAGHRAVVVDLTGLGARQAEFHPGITLTTYIEDTCAAIAKAGLDRFVLAGHSFGGMVITGVAARLGARIDALVYLDAFLPEDGQSLWDYIGDEQRAFQIDAQKLNPAAVPPLPGIMPERADGTPAPLTAHPLLTLIEGVRLTGVEAKAQRRVYVFASGWEPSPFGQFADRVKDDSAWEYHELPCGHDVMGEKPEETLAILLDCA